MPAESIPTQIRAEIQTTLETIVADADYHVRASKVIRVDHFLREWLDKSFDRVYMIRDTSPEIESVDESTFTRVRRDYTVFIMLCAQAPGDFDPFNPSGPHPGTIRDRMIRDVEKKLYVDPKRGGLAIDTNIEEPERDFQGPAGWITAELPVVVWYYHTYGDP